MCNQCEDARRIHGNHIVWVVMKDRKPQMQFTIRWQAERAIAILAKHYPNAVFEIIEDNSYYTKWE